MQCIIASSYKLGEDHLQQEYSLELSSMTVPVHVSSGKCCLCRV